MVGNGSVVVAGGFTMAGNVSLMMTQITGDDVVRVFAVIGAIVVGIIVLGALCALASLIFGGE